MKILAIETSCDETSAAIIAEIDNRPIILSNVVSSQIDIHKEYGGIVPEVAARAHIENILPIIKRVLKEAQLEISNISHIAPTFGPGLIGSLLVGVETAKALSLAKNIPVLPINHLEGHLYANFIQQTSEGKKIDVQRSKEPKFPLLALIISGGHTMLVLMKNHLCYEIIGQTRDDAAGEAFDKAAKIMGLGFPGGPIISKWAEKGNKKSYNFPVIDLTEKPYRDKNSFLRYPEPSLDFSFSGLKTALLTKVKKLTTDDRKLNKIEVKNLAASFQAAITANVTQNVLRAIEKYQPKTFVLSGGVAANKNLRENLKAVIAKKNSSIHYLVPESRLCTDNAAMIGLAAYYHLKKSNVKKTTKFVAIPNLKLGESV